MMWLHATGICLVVGLLVVGCTSTESDAATPERPGFRSVEPTATTIPPTPTPKASPTATAPPSQTEETTPALSLSQRVEAVVNDIVEQGIDVSSGNGTFAGQAIPGTILVGVGDEIVVHTANGLADRENDIAHAPETRFPLGRTIELFIATVALQLHEKGVLDLKAPIGDYLPDFPHGTATVEQLLDRTSALPRVKRGDIANNDGAVALSVAFIADETTRFEPGDHVNFLDSRYERIDESDYIVLRHLIEQVTGSTLEELLAENIFQPAGMDGVLLVSGDSTVEHAAKGYTARFEVIASGATRGLVAKDIEPIDENQRLPELIEDGTAVWATAEDIFRWYRALVNGELVNKELVARMFEPGLDLKITTAGNTAYGWFVNEGFLRKQVWSYAHSEGYSVGIGTSPDRDIFVVVLTNVEEHFTADRAIPPIRGFRNSSTRSTAQ